MPHPLSVIIPTCNCEDTILALIEKIQHLCRTHHITYEIIIIDDHSTDRTREQVRILMDSIPIRLYELEGTGYAQAWIYGTSCAHYETIMLMTERGFAYVETLPTMERTMHARGVDMVIGEQHKSRGISHVMSVITLGRVAGSVAISALDGIVMCKKEIVERVIIRPHDLTYLLELVTKAYDAGYRIKVCDASCETNVQSRSFTHSVGVLIALFQIWMRRYEVIPFHYRHKVYKGSGFHYKGKEFVHHTDLDYRQTAFFRFDTFQVVFFGTLSLIFALGLYMSTIYTLIVLVAVLTVLYFGDMFFNLYLIVRSISIDQEAVVSQEELAREDYRDWPTYTIYCPLYKEWRVLPQFIKAMDNLEYPKAKLQVLLLLEEDDKETIKRAHEMRLPPHFEIAVVPHSAPKTKPKALNYGLQRTRGEYAVIYDAEDMPDRDQLKKAVLVFERSSSKVVCIQAKLNFYNATQNMLTRVFTAEYSLWFDLVLAGLHSLAAPIPLGGTSNHFRTVFLHKLRGWDAFNVTEDCDLGMRLSKMGYQTLLINSYTWEEATSKISNWINQRSRWIKGYIQTYFVHLRRISHIKNTWALSKRLIFHVIVGGKVLSMFINPFMWLTTIIYFTLRAQVGDAIEQFFPAAIYYMAVSCLVFGNSLYMYYYMIASVKLEQYDNVKYMVFVPMYWLLMSWAAWKALFEFIVKPHYWAKTEHGFHMNTLRFPSTQSSS